MANQILYKTITADTQVATTECYLDGIEESHTGAANIRVYDEATSDKTATNLVSKVRVSTYWRYNNIIFPSPGIKCDGIYVHRESATGTGTIYYHYEKSDKIARDILYESILADVDEQITTLPCYLIGAEITLGTITIYDEANSDETAGNLVSTMKIGSYRAYNRHIYSNPIKCNNGLFVASTGGAGTVYYSMA